MCIRDSAYEAIFDIETKGKKQVEIQLPYQTFYWNSDTEMLICGKYQIEIKCDEKLSFVAVFDQYVTEIIAGDKVLVLLNNLTNEAKEISVIDISGNLGKIRVGENNDPHIHVVTEKETETEITVYGPVSYTHLDVYKRQSMDCPGISTKVLFRIYVYHTIMQA